MNCTIKLRFTRPHTRISSEDDAMNQDQREEEGMIKNKVGSTRHYFHAPLGTSSGHKPLTFDLIITADEKRPSPQLQFSFKLASWSLYRQILNKRLAEWD